MPTDGCSVHIPIIIVNSKLRCAKQDSVPYMVKVILTHIPAECGVVNPYVDGFLNGSGLSMASRPTSREIELLRTYWSNPRIKIIKIERVGLSIGTNVGSSHAIRNT